MRVGVGAAPDAGAEGFFLLLPVPGGFLCISAVHVSVTCVCAARVRDVPHTGASVTRYGVELALTRRESVTLRVSVLL